MAMTFEQIWEIVKYRTLLHCHKGRSIHDLLCWVLDSGLEGDAIECGVYRGGISALMGLVLNSRCTTKDIVMFDSFEGSPGRVEGKDLPYYELGSMKGDLRDVEEFMFQLAIRHVLVPGWFSDTFPGFVRRGGKICFLHVDCDLYESARQCLVHLFDRVVPGGVVMFDDYFDLGGGEKAAVDEWVVSSGEMLFAGPMEQVFIIKGMERSKDDPMIDPFGDGGQEVSLRYLVRDREYLRDLGKESFHRACLFADGKGSARLSRRISQVTGYHARVAERLGLVIRKDAVGEGTSKVRSADSLSVVRIGETTRDVVNPGTVNPSSQSHGRGLAMNVNVG